MMKKFLLQLMISVLFVTCCNLVAMKSQPAQPEKKLIELKNNLTHLKTNLSGLRKKLVHLHNALSLKAPIKLSEAGKPTLQPTEEPTLEPTPQPTEKPTPQPADQPTLPVQSEVIPSAEQALKILTAPTCALPRNPEWPLLRVKKFSGEWYTTNDDFYNEGVQELKFIGKNPPEPQCVVCKYLYSIGQVTSIRNCYKDTAKSSPTYNLYSPTCGKDHQKKLLALRTQLTLELSLNQAVTTHQPSENPPLQPVPQPIHHQQNLQKISPATRQALLSQPSTVINFYERAWPYYEFTNFWDQHPMMIDGKQWPTTEHYFQAQKFVGPHAYLQEIIRNLKTPREVFEKTNGKNGTYKAQIRSDWNQVSISVMRKALQAKFSQHKDLLHVLKSTATSTLVEHTVNDNFWGDGGNGTGRNELGKLLMEIRATH